MTANLGKILSYLIYNKKRGGLVPPHFINRVDKQKEIIMKDFEKVLKIVEDKAFSKISGVAVDLFTASFIKSVYDNVNDKNKKCMEDMSIANLIGVAQTLMSKV